MKTAETHQRPSRGDCKHRGEAGFATLFVLLLSAAACLLLTAAIQMSYRVHDQNRRDLQALQSRVQALTVTNPPGRRAE